MEMAWCSSCSEVDPMLLQMMDKMKESGDMSAESLYSEGGGACGNGYELQVKKVIGSTCVCVDESVCGEGEYMPCQSLSQMKKLSNRFVHPCVHAIQRDVRGAKKHQHVRAFLRHEKVTYVSVDRHFYECFTIQWQ